MNVIQKEKQHQELEEEEEEEEEKNKVNRSNLNPSSTGATSNLCTRRLSMDHHKKDQETFPALFIWTQQLPLPSCCSVTISGSFNNWGVQIPLEKKVTSTSTSSTTSSPTSSHTTTTTTTAAAAGGGGSSNNNNNTNTVVSYEIILELPTGTHFYKFCVDGAWKYDPEVAFAQDEYGNINNFITIYPFIDQETKQKSIQKPIRTIIRHGSNELPTMNPIATEELLKIRSKTTTSPILKGAFAKRSSQQQQQQQPSSPKPLALEKALSVCTLREPSETQDLEYGLNIRGKHHSHHSTGEITSRSSRSSSSNSTRAGGGGGEGGRSRTNTLTRSKSEESLCSGTFLEDHLLSSPSSSSSPLRPPSPHTKTASKYARYVQDSISSSILLAATTQHFGGDLVTHEHNLRAQLGGHRSYVAMPFEKEKESHHHHQKGKLILFLVGLPGRGKTFIGHILARHLTWMGHQSKIFNTGEYRRKIVGSNLSHDFWDPKNILNTKKRNEIALKCLDDAIDSLKKDECDCVIFDATNATLKRRQMLRERVQKTTSQNYEMLYIESICESPDLLASSINEMKFNSEDYICNTMEEVEKDYLNRIKHYEQVYEPLKEEEKCCFIKVIDVGRQIFCNQVYGYLQSRIMFLMANLQLKPRPIWLSRHGESIYNTQKKIGGDSGLSPLGIQYAIQLDRFVNAFYPANMELAIWTSTMLRTGMTVERIAQRGRSIVKWKQLDEIDAGICDGMTYEQVAEEMPEEYLSRKNNKLHYRYPRGESYQDVIHRLEPVITELMRIDQPVLIVAHQAILRVLYAYLTNKSPEECPTINIPLHVVIQVTPKAYKCEEVWHRPM